MATLNYLAYAPLRLFVLILVLAENNTSRLQYILSELLERRMGLAFSITSDVPLFSAHEGLKLNYTAFPEKGGIHILPQGLLSQAHIRTIVPVTKPHAAWHTLLWPSAGEVPFDLFSASFYLLSRYEEYLSTQSDEHGRFEAKNSIAFREGFLQVPIVDLWVNELKNVLQKHRPLLSFQQHHFTSLSTIDVDFAYRYKGIGLKRWAGKLLKSLAGLRISEAVTQLAVTLSLKKDPYDTFDFIAEQTKSNLAYFILTNHSGGYDKATFLPVLKPLLRRLNQQALFIGIHPSYASNTRKELLPKEIGKLKEIMQEEIIQSRQHFLKLNTTDTYRSLIQAGIRHDYTMMYAEQAGFRASTCFPFFYYDLHNEQATPLTIHSTCAMDVTLQNYMKLTPAEAIQLVQQLRENVRTYNGAFITLWHNNNLSSPQEEWRAVYRSIFNPNNELL